VLQAVFFILCFVDGAPNTGLLFVILHRKLKKKYVNARIILNRKGNLEWLELSLKSETERRKKHWKHFA